MVSCETSGIRYQSNVIDNQSYSCHMFLLPMPACACCCCEHATTLAELLSRMAIDMLPAVRELSHAAIALRVGLDRPALCMRNYLLPFLSHMSLFWT